MMQRERDYDDILRRALCTAADSIEPSGDGLERIRARLTTPRPLLSAWLMAGYSDVALPALVRLWSALVSMLGWRPSGASRRSARGGFAGHSWQSGRLYAWYPGRLRGGYPGRLRGWHPGRLRGRIPPSSGSHRYGWLRPTAVAAAIVVAVAGGYALTQLQRTVSSTGAEILPLAPGKAHPHAGSADGTAVSAAPGPSAPSSAGPAPSTAFPSASPSCSPGSTPRQAQSTPTATPTASSSPAPKPTPSPSPSQTPSVTPTSTPSSTGGSTQAPATGDSPGTASTAASPGSVQLAAYRRALAVSPPSPKKSSPPIKSTCGSGPSTRSP